jgi:hypothetical protein
MSKRADRVWMRLSQWYGTRWIEAFGPKPTEDWVRAVNGATDEQLLAALSAVRSKHLSHPPTLPEFEAALRDARPKATANRSGDSLVDRLDAAMLRVTKAPQDIRWLARKSPEGKLAIYGVEFFTPSQQYPTRITEDDLAMEAAA